MFYLNAEWVDGTDHDLYKFKTLDEAIEYIKEEEIVDFALSTRTIGHPEQDYILIEDVPDGEQS
jgi:hypothetical protein